MGISFKCDIKGLDELDKKMKKIIKEIPKRTGEGLKDLLKNIQGCAIRIERGHNENGILIEMIETSTMEIKRKSFCKP